MADLTPLGHARVYRDPRNGELVVDTDSIRRTGFAGDDVGYDDDEYGYDDDDVGDDDEYGYDDDDDVGDDDEVGRRGGGRKRRQGGGKRRQGSGKGKSSKGSSAGGSGLGWGMTAVSGTDTLTSSSGGSASVQIRLQHDFKAEDITFDGSLSGAKVTSIFFGDQSVWSNANGIPVTVFGANSFLRGMLKGQSLKAGLDITVNGLLGGAGDFAVTITGRKPVKRG